MFSWLFGKSLNKHLYATKKIRINGINFIIKKINALNYLDGSKALTQSYEIYQVGKADQTQIQAAEKKIKEHFSHVLLAGLVNPKVSLKKEDDKILIDDLFLDFDLVTKIYEEIIFFTYGKKKVK